VYLTLPKPGEKLVTYLVEPKTKKWPSNLPKFATRQEAIAVCKDLCKYQFMHRSEKRGKGDLVVRHVFFCGRIIMNHNMHE
jgi:translocation protein SEC62